MNVTLQRIESENGVVKIKVHQLVHDLNGKLLADESVLHIFHLENNKIARFDIAKTNSIIRQPGQNGPVFPLF